MASWDHDGSAGLTDEEYERVGRWTVRFALACAVGFAILMAVAAVLTLAAADAGAHLVRVKPDPRQTPLEQRERAQARNLEHALYVCRHGGRAHRRWACWAASSVIRPNGQGWLRRELQETHEQLAQRLAPLPAIHAVFGEYGSQAVRVAYCETGGTFDVWARNGQYLGLFQMGSWERSMYGHGSTPLAQARAAYRYFVASGRDWSPWECKP